MEARQSYKPWHDKVSGEMFLGGLGCLACHAELLENGCRARHHVGR